MTAQTIADQGLVQAWPEPPRRVILMISPCRSGSTVLLRPFGYSGIPSFFQPIKNALRWRLEGREKPWLPPREDVVFLKETFGPFLAEETAFDPLAELCASGVDPTRLHLVLLQRDPGAVWSSWCEYWEGRTSKALFERAFAACGAVCRTAERLGIPVETCDFDACLADPKGRLGQLFQALDLRFDPSVVAGWDQRPGFGAQGSGIHMPEEPPAFVTRGVHNRAIEAQGIEAIATAQGRIRPISGGDFCALAGVAPG